MYRIFLIIFSFSTLVCFAEPSEECEQIIDFCIEEELNGRHQVAINVLKSAIYNSEYIIIDKVHYLGTILSITSEADEEYLEGLLILKFLVLSFKQCDKECRFYYPYLHSLFHRDHSEHANRI